MIRCNTCNIKLPYACFHKDRNNKTGYCRTCKECKKEYDKSYKKQNRQKLNEQQRTYYEENKEYYKEYWQEFYQNNKHKWNRRNSTRRARARQATPEWVTSEQKKEMEMYYIYAKEWSEATGESFHVDHMEPLKGDTVSGLNVPWNLAIIPAIDNLKKGNRRES